MQSILGSLIIVFWVKRKFVLAKVPIIFSKVIMQYFLNSEITEKNILKVAVK